jgi:hypothetical protein
MTTKRTGFCKYLPQTLDIPTPKENPNSSAKDTPKENKDVPREIPKDNFASKKYVPDSLIINRDTDINYIHKTVKDFLEKKISTIPSLEKSLKKLEWIRDNSTDENEIVDAKKEIFNAERKLLSLRNKKELTSYESKTFDIILKYNSIKNKKKSFVKINPEDSEDNLEKKELFSNYILIASEYMPIYYEKGAKNSVLSCEFCYPKKNEWEYIEDNYYACSLCSRCIKLPEEDCSFKDMDRLNLSTRYKYSRKGHFKEAVEKFQGTQNSNIPKSLYDMIYDLIEKHKIKNLTKKQISMFLSESEEDYTDYYGDVNLIYFNITGIPPPSISDYEEELYNMFDKQDEVYSKLKEKGEIKSLNVYYKLMKMLQILGYKCKSEDFNMLKTREKILEHDENWHKICKELGWNFIPTI